MERKIQCDRQLGGNLRRLRQAAGMSQEKICAALQLRGCDIGRSTYAKYEAGELSIRESVLRALCEIYGCAYGAFFAGTDEGE